MSEDGARAAAFVIDDDMYGGLGIIGIDLASGTTSLVFDPETGTKAQCESQVGVGVRSVVRDLCGRYLVEADNGSFWFADGSGRAAPAGLRRPSGDGERAEVRVGDDPSLLELVPADGVLQARFLLDARIAAADVSHDETVVVAASDDGALAFLAVARDFPRRSDNGAPD